jgi:hypothetical protein
MPDMTNNPQVSINPTPQVPWSDQGEAALRAFFSQIDQLRLPMFVKLVLPGLFEAAKFDPKTSDMSLMFEKPEDRMSRNACATVETFLEGPRLPEQGFPELIDGQYAMRLFTSTGFAPLSGTSGTARVVFEFDGRNIKLIDVGSEGVMMS